MTREELRDYVEEQRNLGVIPYHVYSTLIDGIDTLEQEPKTKWIPVSERLPEKKVKDYLACCEDGYVATIMYDDGRWLINGNNVIAWMPLPEPYKAEKPETCKGCLEPCIMYEPDMRACKKKVTERGE